MESAKKKVTKNGCPNSTKFSTTPGMLVARALPASLGASSKVGLLFRDRP